MIFFRGNTSFEFFLYLFPITTNVLVYILTPRFVMNIRELYALGTQGRCDIDTGFGLSSGAGRDMGGTISVGTMVFAEGGGSGVWDDGEETATAEERAQSSVRQVSAI